MKLITLIVFVLLIIVLSAGISQAAVPSVINPANGSSMWTYQDSHDTTEKAEGSYTAVDNTTGKYETNPHGGYDSSSNKCKICHAVHRAEGAYFLLRADTQDDACNYCHIGGSAFSDTTVYTLNPSGTATPNGHTIGSSAVIPDSSVKEWTEQVTLSTVDASGSAISETVDVRAYDSKRNKMFRFARRHGHESTGSGSNGYMRVGPLALRCMSCHQQHGAKNMQWRPKDILSGAQLANGYKLLRLSPSASIQGTATETVAGTDYIADYNQGMQNYTSYEEYDPASGKFLVNEANIVKVPETDMSAANTGPGHTIYTTFTGVEPSKQQGDAYDPQTVNQFALSPWCADCHNLDIGYSKNLTNEELGFKSHADRTHPAPYKGAGFGPGQCYSCHRNDLPDKGTPGLPSGFMSTVMHKWTMDSPGCSKCHTMHMGGTLMPQEGNCAECHFGPANYKYAVANINGSGKHSDFPHSGGNDSIKLLGPVTKSMNGDGTVSYGTGVTESNIDSVCLRCHTGVGTNH
jgi:hypothetical protein